MNIINSTIHRGILVSKTYEIIRDLPLVEIPAELRRFSFYLDEIYGISPNPYDDLDHFIGHRFEVMSHELNPLGWVVDYRYGILYRARSIQGPIGHGQIVICEDIIGPFLLVRNLIQPLT